MIMMVLMALLNEFISVMKNIWIQNSISSGNSQDWGYFFVYMLLDAVDYLLNKISIKFRY